MKSLPDLFVPRRHHFGLSIGRTSLRAVETDRDGNVHFAAEILLPDNVFNEGVLVDKQVFVAALNKLLSSKKFTTKYVAVCFSEIYAFSREYILPLIPFDEIHEAVSWKVKDLFPFPEGELYFDWRLLEINEKEYKTIVISVPKKILDPLVEVLNSVGLKPISFEPGSVGIAKLLHLKNGQQALVTEVNRKGAYVTLVEGEKSLFTTVVNFHQNIETQQIYQQNIIDTIREIVSYYTTKGILKENSLQIVLTGEFALEAWVKSIAAQFKYPIKILTTQIKYPAFNRAYAMAISETSTPYDTETVNLLPTSLQELYESEWRTNFYKSVGWRTSIVVFILFLIACGSFLSLNLKRQTLEKQIISLSEKMKNKPAQTQKILLLNAQANMIVQLAPLRISPVEKFEIIKSLLDENIKITQWEYDDSKLKFTLNGVAQDRNSLIVFKNKLEQSDEFIKVILPLDSLEVASNTRFTLNFITKK